MTIELKDLDEPPSTAVLIPSAESKAKPERTCCAMTKRQKLIVLVTLTVFLVLAVIGITVSLVYHYTYEDKLKDMHIITKQITDRTIIPGEELKLNTIDGNTKSPVIHVRNGEFVRFKVTNGINETDSGFSLHWHGLEMRGAQMFDGVVGLTQCSIPPGQSYYYNWKVNEEPGTYWYHTHDWKRYPKGQYDFIRGPMIVHESDAVLPSSSQMYSYQNGNEIILFYTMYYHGGEWFGFLNGEKYGENVKETPVFEVENGEYMFRVINGVGNAKTSFFFGIDGHRLRVISTDAYPVEPYETDMIQVGVAERYDVLVKFDIKTTAENLWIRALTSTSDKKQNTHRVMGILKVRKNVNSVYNPDPPQGKNERVDFTKTHVLNCLATTGCKNGSLVTDLTPSPKIKKRKLLGSFKYHTYDSKEVNIDGLRTWKVSIDNGPFQQNHIPCESGLMKSARNRWSNKTIVLHIPEIKSVTIVIRNLDPNRHPMHMHGHHFEVLEIATGHDNMKDCKALPLDTAFSEPIEKLMKREKQGVLKDTVLLPGCGAVAVRINSDNPGVWFFHCHFDLHLHRGMAIVLNEGGYLFSQPKSALPSDYPSCQTCLEKN